MKLTIGKKLTAAFMFIAILLGLISFLAYSKIQDIDSSYSDLVNRRAAILSYAKEMQINASREISNLRAILLHEENSQDSLSQSINELKTNIEMITPLIQRTETLDTLETLAIFNEQFKAKSEEAIAVIKTNQYEADRLASDEAFPIARYIRDFADQLAAEQEESMKLGSAENTKMVQSVKANVLFLSIAAFIFAIITGLIVTRLISNPIQMITRRAEQIASGYLNLDDIKVKNKDEIGELAKSFNHMNHNLRQLIIQIGHSTDQVAATSEELSASAEQTGKASEQISIAMQEVALGSEKQVTGAVESTQAALQITEGMNQAATSIQSVGELMNAANDKAHNGNIVVNQTVEQMDLLYQSASESARIVNTLGRKSEEIGQIVNLITGIAYQTNLLALNAAIEAARAGEQGKGFAVVAGEVRKLAEQSGNAAEQIRELIEEVQAEAGRAVQSMNEGTSVVQEGIDLVHRTGDTFREIAASIEQVTAESQEVSAIIEQVNASSQSMLEMMEGVAHIAEQSSANTQNVAASAEEQNASMEEVTASAEALSMMAQELQEAISKFKV